MGLLWPEETGELYVELCKQVDASWTGIRKLRKMLYKFPWAIFIRRSDCGLELCYFRPDLVALQPTSFNLGSWERSLRHAGLTVLKTTHGNNNTLKVWRVRQTRH